MLSLFTGESIIDRSPKHSAPGSLVQDQSPEPNSLRGSQMSKRFRRIFPHTGPFRDLFRWRPHRKPFFISHSYKDEPAVQTLLRRLPKRIEPRLFPPIQVSPREMVSDALTKAISECHGLIYLTSQESNASFWVRFERKFAQRLGKDVVAFDPARRAFLLETASAWQKDHVAMVWHRNIKRDHDLAWEIARWLHEERDLGTTTGPGLISHVDSKTGEPMFDYGEEDLDRPNRKVEMDYPIALFLSHAACEQPWFCGNIPLELDRTVEAVWLEPPNKSRIETAFELLGEDKRYASFRRFVMDTVLDRRPLVVAIDDKIIWPRVDDLLIRLEHMLFLRSDQHLLSGTSSFSVPQFRPKSWRQVPDGGA